MTARYLPLEVIETVSRVYGHQFWVRDDEASHLFDLVEYVGQPGRLTCGCDDGEAHAESPDTETPCVHLRAVVDLRMATQKSAGTKLGVLRPGVFCD